MYMYKILPDRNFHLVRDTGMGQKHWIALEEIYKMVTFLFHLSRVSLCPQNYSFFTHAVTITSSQLHHVSTTTHPFFAGKRMEEMKKCVCLLLQSLGREGELFKLTQSVKKSLGSTGLAGSPSN